MATVTDLSGNQNTETDNNNAVSIPEDSNVNVFEFGNLILADILPTILWLINYISDMGGSLLSATDNSGSSVSDEDKTQSNSVLYDESTYIYDSTEINYDGNIIEGSVVDMSGS
jgi:hypothetical protein